MMTEVMMMMMMMIQVKIETAGRPVRAGVWY